jgi:hypothetical protein
MITNRCPMVCPFWRGLNPRKFPTDDSAPLTARLLKSILHPVVKSVTDPAGNSLKNGE